MVKAIFRDALANGTRSWDVTIHNCLSLLLQAATCTRTGDMRQEQGYDNKPVHLEFEHITLKFTGTTEQLSMHMLVRLLFTKGNKDDPAKTLEVVLKSLVDNVLDPVKLLLALALRLGVTKATSRDDLVQDTLASAGRTV